MDAIESLEELRELYGAPSELAVKKELTELDRHTSAFIALSPFVVVATSDAEGWVDASPRGDAPGFVVVDTPKRLLLPDRRGNNRFDTLRNLLINPRLSLLFLVPQRRETLRVHGTATISQDPDLCARLAVNGRPARSVLDIKVAQVYFQCGKALIRSRLWQAGQWAPTDGLATFGEALAEQVKGDSAHVEQALEKSYRDNLY